MPGSKSTLSKFANVAASQTDSELVAANAGRYVRVLSVVINQGDTTASSVTFNTKPAGAGTAISATFKAAANGTVVLAHGDGWFETNTGEGLTVTTGAGSTTAIQITYEWVTHPQAERAGSTGGSGFPRSA